MSLSLFLVFKCFGLSLSLGFTVELFLVDDGEVGPGFLFFVQKTAMMGGVMLFG